MNIKELLPLLEYMHSLSRKRQRKFVEKANLKVIKAISNLAYNINRGNIVVTDSQLNKLKKFKKEILLLSLKKLSQKNANRSFKRDVEIYHILYLK